ncbi:MAG: transglycosylase domain-containing protein [Acidobacteria bacterium]|nr:transglycosylase domain-containing protein [Acidobacteriota bacterium]
MRWWAKCAVVVAALILLAAAWLAWEAGRLPGTDEIRHQLFTQRAPRGQGTWVPLWAVSPKLQSAVVLWEDPAFFHHSGLDYSEIARAARMDLRAGSYRRGASTITQQVAKNLFLTSEKTMTRKIREAILAKRIERALSKDEILTVYLNIAEWGNGIVGAEAASQRYFGKAAIDLNWAEAAMLAGILPNPQLWNPCIDPSRAKQARHAVLTKLLNSQSISWQEFQDADAAPHGSCHDFAVPGLDNKR